MVIKAIPNLKDRNRTTQNEDDYKVLFVGIILTACIFVGSIVFSDSEGYENSNQTTTEQGE